MSVKHGTPSGARSGCPCEWCRDVARGERIMAAGVGRRAHDDVIDCIIELLDRGRRR